MDSLAPQLEGVVRAGAAAARHSTMVGVAGVQAGVVEAGGSSQGAGGRQGVGSHRLGGVLLVVVAGGGAEETRSTWTRR